MTVKKLSLIRDDEITVEYPETFPEQRDEVIITVGNVRILICVPYGHDTDDMSIRYRVGDGDWSDLGSGGKYYDR